jgi:hypothetical protein
MRNLTVMLVECLTRSVVVGGECMVNLSDEHR